MEKEHKKCEVYFENLRNVLCTDPHSKFLLLQTCFSILFLIYLACVFVFGFRRGAETARLYADRVRAARDREISGDLVPRAGRLQDKRQAGHRAELRLRRRQRQLQQGTIRLNRRTQSVHLRFPLSPARTGYP